MYIHVYTVYSYTTYNNTTISISHIYLSQISYNEQLVINGRLNHTQLQNRCFFYNIIHIITTHRVYTHNYTTQLHYT